MLEEYLRQFGLGNARFEGPNDGGGGGPTVQDPEVTEEAEESMSLEEFTNRRLEEAEPTGEDEEPTDEPPESSEETPDSEEDEEPLGPDYEGKDSEDEEPDPDGEPEETPDEPKKDETGEAEEGAGEGEDEAPFYDPEEFKEQKEIDRDIPHTNKFPDRESAEYAAINKASMIKEALNDLEELGTDRGAVPLPDALKGNLDNLDTLENAEHVASMDPDELQQFLWESDEFRHRIQDKAERVEQKRESQQVSQEFKQLQQELYDGISEVLGGEDQITDDVVDKLDAGPAQGRKFLNEKIGERIEDELREDVEAIEEFIDSDEAASMSNKAFANQLESKKQALRDKRDELQQKYGQVVETYEEAYELAPKVQEAKPKTEAEIVTQAYSALDVWQEDAEDFSNLLIDDPGAKRELEAFVKNAMRNKEKFNDLQHPSDWNDAEDWWHNDFKPKIRSKRQKDKLSGEDKSKKSSSKKSGDSKDDIDEPDPDKQEDLRSKEGDDVYSRNESRLDSLVEETDAT